MNCDQVFAILTRGPFPSGDSTDAAVEMHLSFCSECRHFADALRPDGSSDAETLIPEESRGLPYYWGVSAISNGEQASSLTATEGRRTRRRRKSTFFEKHEPLAHLSGWQLAFAVLMGALLGTLLRLLGYTDSTAASSETIASATPAAAVAESDYEGRTEQLLTDKLGAAPICCARQTVASDHEFGADRLPGFSQQSLGSDACCTKCHNAAAPRFALRSTTRKITQTCQVCHDDLARTRLETTPYQVRITQ